MKQHVDLPVEMCVSKVSVCLIILIVTHMCISCIAKEAIIRCPSYCRCDLIGRYKRANCREQKLVTVEAEIPSQVEILDLSQNFVHELSDRIFFELQLTALKALNISHNKISQIHINAFQELTHIKSIDLSYNNLEYLLDNWFWSSHGLEQLYLRRNNLGYFKSGPILDSKTLKILDISYCNLQSLHNEAFTRVPNLNNLDISGNFLLRLHTSVISPLVHLSRLKLKDNPWDCNYAKVLIKYCKSNKIKCGQICIDDNEAQPFAKLIATDFDSNEAFKDSSELNGWIYDDEDDNSDDHKNGTLIISSLRNHEPKDVLMGFLEMSPILALLTPFILGVAFGLCLTCCIVLTNSSKNHSLPYKDQSTVIQNYFCVELQPLSDETVKGDANYVPISFKKDLFYEH